jgi:hypothetical protein
MSERAFLSTRKGLFELRRQGDAWEIGPSHFLGEPVSVTLVDARDGSVYAALNLGILASSCIVSIRAARAGPRLPHPPIRSNRPTAPIRSTGKTS